MLSIFSRPDEEIRREVTDRVIRARPPDVPGAPEAQCEDGIVTLSRPARNRPGMADIIEAVWHIEGVVAVRDELDPDEDNCHCTATSR